MPKSVAQPNYSRFGLVVGKPDQVGFVVAVDVPTQQRPTHLSRSAEFEMAFARIAESNVNAAVRTGQVQFCLVESLITVEIANCRKAIRGSMLHGTSTEMMYSAAVRR